MPPRYPLFDFESTKKLLIMLYTSFKSRYIKRKRTNTDKLKREIPKIAFSATKHAIFQRKH